MPQIEKIFSSFLAQYWDGKNRLLLGLSGGPDSRVLFHLLLDHGIPFEVAHLDHGWREESREEAAYLQKLCEESSVAFHLERVARPVKDENSGRKARLSFFRALCGAHTFQAVLLAHHADDQAETVLKRVFEGASLPRLKGLSPCTIVEGVPLWHPLLEATKGQILQWLGEKEIVPFWDPTNLDPRFLRGRFRSELLPYLSKTFGKEVSSSLCRLGRSAHELSQFLDRLLIPYRERAIERNEGSYLDLSMDQPGSSFEWKCVVKDFFDCQNVTVSTPLLEAVVAHLKGRKVNKTMVVGKREVHVNRGVLFLLKEDI